MVFNGNKDLCDTKPPQGRRKPYVSDSELLEQLNIGFSKACEVFKVHSIDSLKDTHEFYTLVCNYRNIYFTLSHP